MPLQNVNTIRPELKDARCHKKTIRKMLECRITNLSEPMQIKNLHFYYFLLII